MGVIEDTINELRGDVGIMAYQKTEDEAKQLPVYLELRILHRNADTGSIVKDERLYFDPREVVDKYGHFAIMDRSSYSDKYKSPPYKRYARVRYTLYLNHVRFVTLRGITIFPDIARPEDIIKQGKNIVVPYGLFRTRKYEVTEQPRNIVIRSSPARVGVVAPEDIGEVNQPVLKVITSWFKVEGIDVIDSLIGPMLRGA